MCLTIVLNQVLTEASPALQRTSSNSTFAFALGTVTLFPSSTPQLSQVSVAAAGGPLNLYIKMPSAFVLGRKAEHSKPQQLDSTNNHTCQNLPKIKTVLAGSISGLEAPSSAASACRGGCSGPSSPESALHHGCSRLCMEPNNSAPSEGKGPSGPCTAEHTAQNAGTLLSYLEALRLLPYSPQHQTAGLSGQMQYHKAANSLPSLAWHGSVQTLERHHSCSRSGKGRKDCNGTRLQCLEQPCLLYAQCSPVSLPETAAQNYHPNYCQGYSWLAWSCATEALAACHDGHSREAPAAAQQGSCLWRVGTLQGDHAGKQGDRDIAWCSCQNCRGSRPYRNAQDRLLWRHKTCPAHS